jgi:hypothetical protein
VNTRTCLLQLQGERVHSAPQNEQGGQSHRLPSTVKSTEITENMHMETAGFNRKSLLICIRKITESNPGREVTCPHSGFRVLLRPSASCSLSNSLFIIHLSFMAQGLSCCGTAPVSSGRCFIPGKPLPAAKEEPDPGPVWTRAMGEFSAFGWD